MVERAGLDRWLGDVVYPICRRPQLGRRVQLVPADWMVVGVVGALLCYEYLDGAVSCGLLRWRDSG